MRDAARAGEEKRMTTQASEPDRPASDGVAPGTNGSGPVQDIVSRIDAAAQGERVTLGEVVAAFGRRSFIPVLMVPALLVVSPLSGVPLFSAACGIAIALIAAQMLWPGRDTLWLPDRLMRQQVSGARARRAVGALGRLARWLDKHARDRLRVLVVRTPGRSVLEGFCMLAGAAMPFFEVVPFTSSTLGFGVLLIATGLLTRDGLFAVAGMAVLVVAPLVPVVILGGLLGATG